MYRKDIKSPLSRAFGSEKRRFFGNVLRSLTDVWRVAGQSLLSQSQKYTVLLEKLCMSLALRFEKHQNAQGLQQDRPLQSPLQVQIFLFTRGARRRPLTILCLLFRSVRFPLCTSRFCTGPIPRKVVSEYSRVSWHHPESPVRR
jgi:hypothetical protein